MWDSNLHPAAEIGWQWWWDGRLLHFAMASVLHWYKMWTGNCAPFPEMPGHTDLAGGSISQGVPMNIADRKMPSARSQWKGGYVCSVSGLALWLMLHFCVDLSGLLHVVHALNAPDEQQAKSQETRTLLFQWSNLHTCSGACGTRKAAKHAREGWLCWCSVNLPFRMSHYRGKTGNQKSDVRKSASLPCALEGALQTLGRSCLTVLSFLSEQENLHGSMLKINVIPASFTGSIICSALCAWILVPPNVRKTYTWGQPLDLCVWDPFFLLALEAPEPCLLWTGWWW